MMLLDSGWTRYIPGCIYDLKFLEGWCCSYRTHYGCTCCPRPIKGDEGYPAHSSRVGFHLARIKPLHHTTSPPHNEVALRIRMIPPGEGWSQEEQRVMSYPALVAEDQEKPVDKRTMQRW